MHVSGLDRRVVDCENLNLSTTLAVGTWLFIVGPPSGRFDLYQ